MYRPQIVNFWDLIKLPVHLKSAFATHFTSIMCHFRVKQDIKYKVH